MVSKNRKPKQKAEHEDSRVCSPQPFMVQMMRKCGLHSLTPFLPPAMNLFSKEHV
jgi:hypothetical protein